MGYDRILKNWRRAGSAGFTLVELLVVITIIGILVGMLLPGVQAARETARKAQCSNNLRQWGLAALQHEEGQGYYPTGGWGWAWVGDPDRGFDWKQPGGWLYNCLPFVEQTALHNLGMNNEAMIGTTVTTLGATGATTDNTKRPYWALKMIQTPVPIANCPTRRRSMLFTSTSTQVARNFGGVNAGSPNVVARTDYAGCVGHVGTSDLNGGGPPAGQDLTQLTCPQDVYTYSGNSGAIATGTGVMYFCSQVSTAQIRNGTSNVIFAGEKYDNPDEYSGSGQAENENMYVGIDNDVNRLTSFPPMMDRIGYADTIHFGSAHPQGCNFVFCDGSIHSINYSIDPTTFMNLGRRGPDASDYMPIDASKL